MRSVLLILVLGNLLLLGLVLTPNPAQPPGVYPPPLPPGVKRLQLLSERPAAEAEPVPKKAETVTAPEQRADKPETEPTAEASQAQAVAAPEPLETETVVSLPEQEKEAAPAPQPVCHTLGPFETEQQAQAMSRLLTEKGLNTALRRSEIQEPAGYWVYLPSMPREQARDIVNDLVAHNIKDYFLGARNYISLGIFSVHEIAKQRVEEIKALGYKPKLEQRFKMRDIFWLDTEEPQPLLTKEDWQALLASQEGIRRQDLACE